jgi:phosphopentomutase
MSRAFLIVMDSAGIGGAQDAHAFFNGTVPDTGANTLMHIAQVCAEGLAEDGRSGPLHVPNLERLGLGAAMRAATNEVLPGFAHTPEGLFGAAREISLGKDTPSGHWELAGVPVPWDWHYFPDETNGIPEALLAYIAHTAGTPHTLANCHMSGTDVIDQYGEEHAKTGCPIVYTSADSVLQIAAHEEHFGRQKLLDLCRDIAPTFHKLKLGRVIARPFVDAPDGGFTRTAHRKDYAIEPPSPTLLDWAQGAGRKTYAIGKIGDIFSMRGVDDLRKGTDAQLMEHLLDVMKEAPEGSFTFANFVEFDSKYGHRRDVSGYARHLEWFDTQVGHILALTQPDDLILFTADHGNDPTWIGTDHTREMVPVLGHGLGARDIGVVGFSDVATSIAAHLNISAQGPGRSFL